MSTLATQNNGQESGFPVLHTIHIASTIRYAYIIWGRDKKVLDMNEERGGWCWIMGGQKLAAHSRVIYIYIQPSHSPDKRDCSDIFVC